MQPKRMMTRFSRIDNERSLSFGMLDIIVRFIEVNVAVFNKHVARGIRCFDLNGLGRVSKKQIFFLSILKKKRTAKKEKHTLCGREMFGIDTWCRRLHVVERNMMITTMKVQTAGLEWFVLRGCEGVTKMGIGYSELAIVRLGWAGQY